MTDYQTFIEIEEGGLSLAIAERQRHGFELLIQIGARLASLERNDVLMALREVLGNLPGRVESAHVAIGERRSIHFLSKVPMLSPREMSLFINREAHRLGSLAPDVEVLSSSRYLKPQKNSTHLFGAVALPAHVWEPVGAAFEELGIEVLSLTSIEDAASEVLPEDFHNPAAILECSAGKVRFVYCEHGSPAHVRRFLLPGGESALGDSTLVATQLAMEVPRTLDYFCDQNCEQVRSLLISHKFGLDDTLAPMVSGDVEDFRLHSPPIAVDRSQQPGLATYGMMARALAGKRVSLLHDELVEVPLRLGTKLLAAAGVLLGVAAGSAVFTLAPKSEELRLRAEASAAERSEVSAELNEVRVQQAAEAERLAGVSPDARRLAELLHTRRPVSLMLASVAAAAPDGVAIEQLSLAPGRTIVVSGRVEGESRMASLDGMAAFSKALGRIGCVAKVDEQVAGGVRPGSLQFTIHLDWRSL